MMIEIDGSHGEGGGALLRNALALSAVLGEPARIFNIRAGRKEPGLKMQHLTAVKALQKICNAKVSGAEKASAEIVFEPGKISGGEFWFDVGTAGSVTLVLQALMPALAFAEKETELKITGGTHVNWSPPFEYLEHVLLPQLGKMGYSCVLELVRCGWYPKGRGSVKATVKPVGRLKPLKLVERGKLVGVHGISLASNLPDHVAKRQAAAVMREFPAAEMETGNSFANSPGSAVVLWAEFAGGAILGASSLGAIGKKAEAVGKEAADALKAEIKSKAAVDAHLADQLLVYMALAGGKSEILAPGLSGHAKSNIWLIERFIKKRFEIEDRTGGLAKISINGIGLGGLDVASGNAP